MPDHLHLDFETRSELDLSLVGAHNYAAHPSTRILMLAWTLNDRQVKLWEPHRVGCFHAPRPEHLPAELREAVLDPVNVVRVAWHADFERLIFRYCMGLDLPVRLWHDPMLTARYLALPGSLDDAGKVLGLKAADSKLASGSALIKLFSEPRSLGGQEGLFGVTETLWNDWTTHPREWEQFGGYCRQDVRAERAIDRKIARWGLPELQLQGWELDQRINERGIPVDMALVAGAARVAETERARLAERLFSLTGLDNPNSIPQMLEWARQRGYPFNALGKAFVNRALHTGEGSELAPECREALTLRQQAAKASVHKLDALRHGVSPDGRLRGQFVYGGASRTLRWSGTGVQMQNLPRPSKAVEQEMDLAVSLLRAGDHPAILRHFGKPLDVVVSAIRPMFRAPAGQRFVVCDLNAIENRMLGWLSRAPGILRVFAEKLDPYKDFATELYGKAYTDVTKDERNNSKPAVLGCGYRLGGGEDILDPNGDEIKTGLLGYAAAMGVILTPEEAANAVKVFRNKFPEVKQHWFDLENAAVHAVRHPGEQVPVGQVVFHCQGTKILRILLPSGRALHYLHPKVEKEMMPWGKEKDVLSFMARDQKTRQWGRTKSHGGHLEENLCQALSRDVLLDAMLRAEDMGFAIVLHVHDEIGALQPLASPLGARELEACMSVTPEWAKAGGNAIGQEWPDLPLNAEGYEDDHYRKG